MCVYLFCSFYVRFDMGVLRKTKSVKIVLNEFAQNSSATSVITLIDRLKSLMNKTNDLSLEGNVKMLIQEDVLKKHTSNAPVAKNFKLSIQ